MNNLNLPPVADDPPRQQEKLLITVSEAAKLMATGRNTVYELLHQGRLPYIRLGTTRGYRILRQDLLDWIEGERVNTHD